MGAFAGLYLVAAVACVVLVIAWIILPFALIGTKPLLRELIAAVREQNALLADLRKAAPAALPATRGDAPAGGWLSGS